MTEAKPKRRRKKKHPGYKPCRVGGEMIVRTYGEIQAELARRHGWNISKGRIQQLCAKAESKLRKQLAGMT